jgi:ribosomal protein S18 acetylase RimI-like enzyme
MNTPSTSIKNLDYRRPELTDVDLIKNLFEIILENSFPMFSAPAKHAYKQAWTEAKIIERIMQPRDLLLVCWDQQKPVGLVSGAVPEAGVGTIIWLLVDAQYRGQHIGQKLLEQGRDYYRQLNCHKLKLTAPSEEARDFYIRQGMSIEGFHPQHWWQADYWALGCFL